MKQPLPVNQAINTFISSIAPQLLLFPVAVKFYLLLTLLSGLFMLYLSKWFYPMDNGNTHADKANNERFPGIHR